MQGGTQRLSSSPDGQLVATSGSNNTVVVWTSDGEEVAKYTHQEAVTALAFNRGDMRLASGSASELVLWNPSSQITTRCKASAHL